MPRIPLRAFRLVCLVGAVGVALSLGLAVWFAREAQRSDEARFFQLGNAIGVDLERRVEAIEGLLRDLQRVLNAMETPDLLAWDEFMNQASPQWNLAGVLAIGYATNAATPHALETMEAWRRPDSGRTRAEFFRLPPELQTPRAWRPWVWDVYAENLRPPGEFTVDQSVTNTSTGRIQQRRFQGATTDWHTADSPFGRFEAQGQERIVAEEHAVGALPNAIYRDDVKITHGETVLRRMDGASVRGATMLVPTYHPRRAEFWRTLAPSSAPAEESFWLRWNLNTGVLFAQLDLAAMLREVHGPGAPAVRVEIHSAYMEAGGPQGLSAASWLNPDGQPLRASDPTFRAAHQFTHLWRMYGDRWTLFFHTTPLFDAQSTRYRAMWAGGWGLLTTALVCWALALQVAGRWHETQRATALTEARDALVSVQQQRERLSHDLHDGAIQSLYAVQLGLTQVAQEVRRVAAPAGLKLVESRTNLDAVITELRQFMVELGANAPPPPPHGLAAVLNSIVRRLRPASSAAIELLCDPATTARLDEVQAVHLAGVAREALSNSLRHAHARRITLRLATEGQAAVLEIRDDGKGFDPAAHQGKGVGLASLQRRARSLGGHLHIQSAPGQGTTVTVRASIRGLDAGSAADVRTPTES